MIKSEITRFTYYVIIILIIVRRKVVKVGESEQHSENISSK